MQVILDVSEYQTVAQLDQLLKSADDEIVAVYIKGSQGLFYRDSLAKAFAQCAIAHDTPFSYYDYLTNDQASEQAIYFSKFVATQPIWHLRQMLDCEGSYAKGAAGVSHWDQAYGGHPSIIYAQLSNMPQYAGLPNPKWVAQYDSMGYYRPSVSEIESYRSQGYVAWQWTSNYMGLNQDASVLLVPLADISL